MNDDAVAEKVLIQGEPYDVVHRSSEDRVLVMFGGAYVFADRIPGTSAWDLSGVPARDGIEKEVLGRYVREMEAQGTVVKVTEP